MTQSQKKLGDWEIVTADEIGWDNAEQTVKDSESPRSEPVKRLLANGTAPQAIFARQYVRHSHRSNAVVARTRAITVTAYTKAGDALAATYLAHLRAALGEQADTIRFGSNSVCLTKGESMPVYGVVGPWHVLEASAFRRASFAEVSEVKVASSVVTAVRDWTRGKDLVFMMLPSIMAVRAAAELREKVAMIEEIEDCLLLAQARDGDPDPRLLRKYHELKIGLDAYWFFVGMHRKIAIEREPSVEAITAAKAD